MEQEVKKNSRASVGIRIIICCTGLLAIVYFAIPLIALKVENSAKANIKYASSFDLPTGHKTRIEYNNWSVKKDYDNGKTYLYISNPREKMTEEDYLSYLVYDSSKNAKKAYDNYYKEYENYAYAWESGDQWFTSGVPGVCDAEIFRTYYLEDNIIIVSEEVVSCWAESYEEGDETVPTESYDTTDPSCAYYNRTLLKSYVLEHAPEIRRFVIENILGY